MDHQDKAKPTIPHSLRRQRDTLIDRRSTINEISFTYGRLMRLLPTIIKRMEGDFTKRVLNRQQKEANVINAQLALVANAQGTPPGPCVCEEADAIVENIYHEERAATTREARTIAVIQGLKIARTYLIRAWGRLIGTLSEDADQAFLETAHALQRKEADLFRELVLLGQQLETVPQGTHALHGGRRTKRLSSRQFGRLRFSSTKGGPPHKGN